MVGFGFGFVFFRLLLKFTLQNKSLTRKECNSDCALWSTSFFIFYTIILMLCSFQCTAIQQDGWLLVLFTLFISCLWFVFLFVLAKCSNLKASRPIYIYNVHTYCQVIVKRAGSSLKVNLFLHCFYYVLDISVHSVDIHHSSLWVPPSSILSS